MHKLIVSVLISASVFAQTPEQKAAEIYAKTAGALSGYAPLPKKDSKEKPVVMPSEVRVERIASIPDTVKPALAIARQGIESEVPGVKMAADGKLLYSFPGNGVFPIVCTPSKLTEIDFEPGETIDEKNIEQSDRSESVIEHQLHVAGSGAQQFFYLDLRAINKTMDITMTVGTSKRVYYFHVLSTDTYMPKVSFYYPEEEEAQQEQEAARVRAQQEQDARLVKSAPPADIVDWNYTKSFHGKSAKLMDPVSVGDDKTRTYIQFSEKIRKIGLPALEVHSGAGVVAVNSHWENTKLVVDAIFEEACLLSGVGKNQQRVCIKNGGNGSAN